MSDSARFDAWLAGENYERFMGRWSRALAPRFLDWLDLAPGLRWLEVGCGSGALSSAILERQPASLLAIDTSEDFVRLARRNTPDARAEFQVGDGEHLDLADAAFDVAVSGLVLNFLQDRRSALSGMAQAVVPGGTVAFYVWDYPNGGLEFLRAFWRAASVLDPAAAELAERKRFPFCTPKALTALAEEAGLRDVVCSGIETRTTFSSFDDYWVPFTLGAGPAPGYCASLPAEARERLRSCLEADLPRRADGAIDLGARAWAVRGIV